MQFSVATGRVTSALITEHALNTWRKIDGKLTIIFILCYLAYFNYVLIAFWTPILGYFVSH